MLSPISDQVLIEFEKPVEQIGRILLAEPEKTYAAKVIAAGPGRVLDSGVFIETTVKKGDRVLIDKLAYTTEIEIDGKKMSVVRESQGVLGILDTP